MYSLTNNETQVFVINFKKQQQQSNNQNKTNQIN